MAWINFGNGLTQIDLVNNKFRIVGSKSGEYFNVVSSEELEGYVQLNPSSTQSGTIEIEQGPENDAILGGFATQYSPEGGVFFGAKHTEGQGQIFFQPSFMGNNSPYWATNGITGLKRFLLDGDNATLGKLNLSTTPTTDATPANILTWDAITKEVKKVGVDVTGGLASVASLATGQTIGANTKGNSATATTALTASAPVSASAFKTALATSLQDAKNVNPLIEHNGTASYGVQIVGTSTLGSPSDLFLVGQSGFSNGLTIRYDGTKMDYNFASGNIAVPNGNITANNLVSGTYTPTITNITNVSASLNSNARYIRVGNEVTVTGSLEVINLASVATSFSISLPIVSDFTNNYDASGVGTTSLQLLSGNGWVVGDVTNNLATYTYPSIGTGHGGFTTFIYYSFAYTVK